MHYSNPSHLWWWSRTNTVRTLVTRDLPVRTVLCLFLFCKGTSGGLSWQLLYLPNLRSGFLFLIPFSFFIFIILFCTQTLLFICLFIVCLSSYGQRLLSLFCSLLTSQSLHFPALPSALWIFDELIEQFLLNIL